MKLLVFYLWVIGFIIIVFLLLEFIIDFGEEMVIVKYFIFWGILVFVFLFVIVVEIIVESLKSIFYRGFFEDVKVKFLVFEK